MGPDRKTIHRLILAVTGLALLAPVLIGCEGPRNYGRPSSYRVESRMPDEGPNPGSADLVVATDRMVASIATVEAIRAAGGQTVIVMDRIDNQTSDPTADFQIFLARIRAALNQSGAREDLVFVETRNRAQNIRAREGIDTSQAARTRPAYALTGVFYDMPRGRTNYYLMTFQLVDLGNDQVIWEGDYEVKL